MTGRRPAAKGGDGPAHRLMSIVRWVAAAIVFAYAALILGWVLSRLAWGDRWWPVALLNSFPALLFVPAPVMLLLAIAARRRWVWAAALVPLLLWVGLFGWRFLPRVGGDAGASAASAALGQEQLRVMAFNVLAENRNVDGLARVIEKEKPDLIALAELSPSVDGALAQRVGANYPYRTREVLQGSSFGMAIYSRWPLDDLGSLQTGLGLRSAVADVRTPLGTVRFVALHPRATHTVWYSWRAAVLAIQQSFHERRAQMAAVCDYVEQWGDRPLILAGDFNMTEFSDAYRCANRRLHDGFRVAGRGYGNTWPNDAVRYWPLGGLSRLPALTRIDYVFYSGHWAAIQAHVPGDVTGSDHRPVVVTLKWKRDAL